ncbi:MAG: protein kinase [Myxococcota bacterium]
MDETRVDDELAASPTPEPPGNSPGAMRELRKARMRAALFDKPELAPTLGRFRVARRLGQGGMGTVFEGYDDTLGRKVAIKVLHTDTGRQHEQRLLREAQALAKLSHPNVVQVYETGYFDGRLFIAMELVSGQTLREWQAEPRGWRACLQVYTQAGRGLVAAHGEGMVHRDFKPANCIIDDEGRVRVLDFGLVRDRSEDAQSEPDTLETNPGGSALALELTRPGTVLGTVAYMAPEQLRGRGADARSDQFGFCVSLFEALYGVRPFAGGTASALLVAIEEQQCIEPREAPFPGVVPPWLRQVVLRGLSPEPAERFDSMRALLDELERVPRRRRRIRSAVFGLGALGAVGGAVAAGSFAMWNERPCETLAEAEVPGWTDADETAVRSGLEAADAERGTAAWEQAQTHLSRYAEQWSDARMDACMQTRVHHRAGDETLALRMACLDRHSVGLEAVVEQLAQANASTAAHAAALVRSLPSLQECNDEQALHRGPSPVPAALEGPARDVRASIARSWVSQAAGEGARGLDQAETAVEQARALDEAPRLLAEALYNRGHLYRWARRLQEAREDLALALQMAEASGDQGLAVDALRRLLAVAVDEGDASAIDAWMPSLRGKLSAAGPDAVATTQQLEGMVASFRKQHDAAAEALVEATAWRREAGPGHELELARGLMLLGRAYRDAKRDDEALAVFDEALEVAERESLLPMVAALCDEKGYLHFIRGDHDQARPLLLRSIELRVGIYGESTPSAIRSRLKLARIHQTHREIEEATTQADLIERSLGPRVSPMLASEAWMLRASLHRMAGDIDAAIGAYDRSAEALRSMASPNQVELGMLDSNVGDCFMTKGEFERARPRYERALRVLDEHAEPDDPRLIYPLYGLGSLQASEGDYEEAARTIRRALGVSRGLSQNPAMFNALRWNLAKVLVAQPGPSAERSAEARTLAEQAAKGFSELGNEPMAQRVNGWIEQKL